MRLFESHSLTPPSFSFIRRLSTMNNALSKFLENKISLELPLKHPEVYHVTYMPEFPGPLVSTIVMLLSIVLSVLTF